MINCAAYTNVDGAESQKELAHRVNGEAVGQLGRLAAERGKWVLHFSTDFVFDGELDRPYAETDAPNPINEYGRSKLAGERLLAQSGCSHCIVRLEWTYGTHGNNFVTKIIERARASGQLKVVDDQVGSPTATTEVAAVGLPAPGAAGGRPVPFRQQRLRQPLRRGEVHRGAAFSQCRRCCPAAAPITNRRPGGR